MKRIITVSLLLVLCLALGACGGAKKEYLAIRSEDGVPCVCVDAGHGFADPGALSDLLGEQTEREINLAVALLLARELRARGFTVVLTHSGEQFPVTSADDGDRVFSPQERVAYAKTQPIDLFVSLHCDSFPDNPAVSGVRDYYAGGTAWEQPSELAARTIADAVDFAFPTAKETLVKRMEADSAYYVLREAEYPAVLVEMGFISNGEDAEKMLTEAWQADFARALADAVASLFDFPQKNA